jgi:hypothetical protein
MKMKVKDQMQIKRPDGGLRATLFSDGYVNITVEGADGGQRVVVLTDRQRKKLLEFLK